jgi:hypothetical protein
MDFMKIYELGRAFPYAISIDKDQKKLDDIYASYTSKEINATILIVFIFVLFVYFFLSSFSSTLAMVIFFLGTIFVVILYLYPYSITYSKKMMEYEEQMFRAVMSLSNYISMNTSMEYAFFHTIRIIHGILHIEFNEIINSLQRKEYDSLGDVIEQYVPKWNKVNPTFVKSLRLLQTSLLVKDSDRLSLLQETNETLMTAYKIKGKRFAEDLANKAKGLISFGIMLPVMSLMLLPLMSIFLADIISAGALFFIYNIIFPTILLLVALDFAYKRIQIDTIHLERSPNYTKIPLYMIILSIGIAIALALPGLMHISTIDISTEEGANKEYSFGPVFKVWLISAGIAFAVYILATYFILLHDKEWKDIKAAEDDLPHLLQIFGTYLKMNIPIENIIPRVSEDYKEEGFSDHPIVRVFNELARQMKFAKEDLKSVITETLNKICPSEKLGNMLHQILSFSDISQSSAAKATKLIRTQSLATIELDDYIRTLLAETISLISISATLLLPLLSAIAVLMSIIIVKAISFITLELKSIASAMGTSEAVGLNIIDITQILPPTMLEFIVSLYFIEMYFVLSLFTTKIEIGDDNYIFAKKLKSNLVSYLIFSVILIGGFFAVESMFGNLMS